MSTEIFPPTGFTRSRSLSFKHLEAWSMTGDSHRRELDQVLKGITKSLHISTSPSKTSSAAMKKLETFFSRPEVRGDVQQINNRHIKFRLAFPKTEKEGIVFCSMQGEINARTGAVNFYLSSPIKISIHALQRLIERLDDQSDRAVLNEIYSSMAQVIPWHKGANNINAKCWPLMSENGFFIGAADDGNLTTTLITWIKASGQKISKKWGLPLSNLLKLRSACPDRFEDWEFAQEFIRSFPWMLHEHVPGEDQIAIAWEQRDETKDRTHAEEAIWEKEPDSEEILESTTPAKLSASYVAGLNYQTEAPPFKTHSLHAGIVVQKRTAGQLIVGLRNGWVGVVPLKSLRRGMELILDYKEPNIGDYINVFVHKISYFPDEQAYAISLDPKDIAEANWAGIERAHPVGMETSATLVSKFNQEYVAHLDSGIRGVIPATEVKKEMHRPTLYAYNPIGTKCAVQVIGYRPDKKSLLLSLRNIELAQKLSPLVIPYKAGDKITGICSRKEATYALFELDHGFRGMLHALNNWGKELPEINSKITTIFISYNNDSGTIQLGREPPNDSGRAFYAISDPEYQWIEFTRDHAVGDIIYVQVLYWQESKKAFLVSTSNGIVGRVPAKEVDWLNPTSEQAQILLKPGEFLDVKLIKIEQEKRKLTFSKKALEKNLTSERILALDTNNAINGEVVSVLDYGCFIKLHPYGIEALLHRTEVPEGRIFEKGDCIDVFIKDVDTSKNRVSLSLRKSS
jgi:ribosomal protein S1